MRRLEIAILITVGFGAAALWVATRSELAGELAILRTADAAGHTRETRLWFVEYAGSTWVRADRPDRRWLRRLEATPEVAWIRSGRGVAAIATPDRTPATRAAIDARMAARYGWADRWRGMLRGAEDAVPVRIEAVDGAAIERGMRELVARAESLRDRARTFDARAALDALPPSRVNGASFRFDEALRDARISEPAAAVPTPPLAPVARFEFDDSDSNPLQPAGGDSILEAGVLRLTQSPATFLTTPRAVSIPRDAVGTIELRVKMERGNAAILYWSTREPDPSFRERHDGSSRGIARLTIDTIPDGRFHRYRVDARTVLRKHTSDGSTIRTLGLLPSRAAGDRVEVDYLRFLSKRQLYAAAPAGHTHETIGREMRSVLYVDSPRSVRYDVAVPPLAPTLRFGMGVLRSGDPVRFRVTVGPGEGEEVFSAEHGDADRWRDAEVDLSRWAGRTVPIALRADSAGGNVAFWSNPVLSGPPRERFNVLVVLEDALRADHLGLYGHEHDTSPRKARFARDGVVFERAYSQATKTRPSCPSFMTSLYPSATGVVDHTRVLDDRFLTLAEILRSQGFATASLSQNSNAGPAAGLHQGFDQLFDRETASGSEALFSGPMLDWIEANRERNFFLYLHAIDPHGAYDPPSPYDHWYRSHGPGVTPVPSAPGLFDPVALTNPTVEGRRLLYDGEIEHNDRWFGELLDQLERLGLREHTLVITLADHGEHLGEHGLWGHNPPSFAQVVHVPLVMVHPQRLPAGRRVETPVSLLDLVPTILDLAGIDRSPLLLAGDSLLPLAQGDAPADAAARVVVAEEPTQFANLGDSQISASAFFGRYHLVSSARLREDRLFDVARDADEDAPIRSAAFRAVLSSRVVPALRRLYGLNREIRQEIVGAPTDVIDYDPAAQEQLRELGYIE